MQADWRAVGRELDLWSEAGRIARLWLRDDDAIAATPALDRLLALSDRQGVPVLLAVIPMTARPCLAQRLEGCDAITVAMHGVWHRNGAVAGQKKQELYAELGHAAILDRLRLGRARLQDLFGERRGGSVAWYVPPWNRIAPSVAAQLPEAGFGALSCFAAADHGVPGLVQRNTHLDLIDWQRGRRGKPEAELAAALVAELARARGDGFRPLGVLAHHLDHDDETWSGLATLIEVTARHPAVRWVEAGALLS